MRKIEKSVMIIDLWRYIDKDIANKFEKYIGYGICLDNDEQAKELYSIWKNYE